MEPTSALNATDERTECSTGCINCTEAGLTLNGNCLRCDEALGFVVSLDGSICGEGCPTGQFNTTNAGGRQQCFCESNLFVASAGDECVASCLALEFGDENASPKQCKGSHTDMSAAVLTLCQVVAPPTVCLEHITWEMCHAPMCPADAQVSLILRECSRPSTVLCIGCDSITECGLGQGFTNSAGSECTPTTNSICGACNVGFWSNATSTECIGTRKNTRVTSAASDCVIVKHVPAPHSVRD